MASSGQGHRRECRTVPNGVHPDYLRSGNITKNYKRGWMWFIGLFSWIDRIQHVKRLALPRVASALELSASHRLFPLVLSCIIGVITYLASLMMHEVSAQSTGPAPAAEACSGLSTVLDSNDERNVECEPSETARAQTRTGARDMDDSTVEMGAAVVTPNNDHQHQTHPSRQVTQSVSSLPSSPVTPQHPSKQTVPRTPGSAPAIVIQPGDTARPIGLGPDQGRRIRGNRTVSAPDLTKDAERSLGHVGNRGIWTPEIGVRFGDRRQDDEASTLLGTPSVTPSPTRARRGVALKPGHSTPAHVDSHLRVCLREPVKPDTGTGYVYVAVSPDRPGLVKIGFTGQEVVQRERSLSGGCRISFTKIRHSSVRFAGYKRVENLAHAELAQFRRYFICQWCQVVHHEWFEIDEDVAFHVIERWRLFAMQDPWTVAGELKPFWSRPLDTLCGPAENEEYDHHHKREQRWNFYASPTSLLRLACFVATIHPHVGMLLRDLWRYWCILSSLYLVLLLPHHAGYPALLAVTLAGVAHYKTSSSS